MVLRVGDGPSSVPARRLLSTARAAFGLTTEGLRLYFTERAPRFVTAWGPAFALCLLIYTRSPSSNYIFDEQEALLANPYVNGRGVAFWQVLERDFWGLSPERTIGSYRPLPNLIWRALWTVTHVPWFHHLVNVVVHATNAALLTSFVYGLSRDRLLAWLSGAVFVTSAILTETVTGVVGLADVLGGLGILLGLFALRAPLGWLPVAVFGSVLLGLSAKESALVAVPLLGWAALVLAPVITPDAPRRLARVLLASIGAISALVVYTYVRRYFFPVNLPEELRAPLPASEPWIRHVAHEFLRWFQQPRLPRDPMNNPLVDAELPYRVAGALRVYCRGLGQVLFPWRLSGDYSYPAEPVPERLVFVESVVGGLALVTPVLAGGALWAVAVVRERRVRRSTHAPTWISARVLGVVWFALALVWVPVAYFPHSNIPVLLPTVRAERFWYVPVIGTSLLLAWGLRSAIRRWPGAGVTLTASFLGIQALSGRWHALDYTDDLVFWRATRDAVPNSAKAQLNYSVMLGARGELEERLRVNRRAMELAPFWAMAEVYYADALCRAGRVQEAWPHYARGFEKAPGDPNLIALGLQCLWDHGEIAHHHDELLAMGDRHPGSWLAYLAYDIVHNGEKHGGVERKYRPRGYDEGPKD